MTLSLQQTVSCFSSGGYSKYTLITCKYTKDDERKDKIADVAAGLSFANSIDDTVFDAINC
eukprot:CAMPEP_0202719016 /NCGR_PEP_ID=MMETSP1385-20130828/127328_1 /ASSEMBLY_ACC=CAM_ASM_000861 /TAXON_ID=933848 /ORGANISM="Elphidium margaritaceum" /LENGTH=60 /DNA_ID=CAMNT_0049381991 /DNA_START=64 /DNA_END=243 /DNA_ORIENTATION=-